MCETDVAKIERDDFATPETLGLTVGEGKLLTAAAQAEIMRAQVAEIDERFGWCEHWRDYSVNSTRTSDRQMIPMRSLPLRELPTLLHALER